MYNGHDVAFRSADTCTVNYFSAYEGGCLLPSDNWPQSSDWVSGNVALVLDRLSAIDDVRRRGVAVGATRGRNMSVEAPGKHYTIPLVPATVSVQVFALASVGCHCGLYFYER